ncbi:MAG: signal peptidase I [Clostridiales bacterium]
MRLKKINNYIINEVLCWVYHLSIAVMIALVLTSFVFQRTIVNKNSMLPTLKEGDNLIVEKLSKRFNNFSDGDIVTIYAPKYVKEGSNTIIKRIIATEGETIKIKNGKVYVNNKPVLEEYIMGNFTRATGDYINLKVSKNHVYVLGDNRESNILDSRIMGQIPVDSISGKAIIRIFPLKKVGIF